MALNVCDSYEEVLRVFLSEVYPVCVGCNQALRSPEWRSQEQICLASDWLVDYQGKPIRGRKGAGHFRSWNPPGDVTHWFVDNHFEAVRRRHF